MTHSCCYPNIPVLQLADQTELILHFNRADFVTSTWLTNIQPTLVDQLVDYFQFKIVGQLTQIRKDIHELNRNLVEGKS